MICRKCGKQIVTLAEYHTKYCCRDCFNEYHRKYNREYYRDAHDGKMRTAGCDFDCPNCKKPDCTLPISNEDKNEKYINAEIW